jgi:hypothetical protein
LHKNEYAWETRALADGLYRVRIEATDEDSNPDPFVERSEADSGPVLVDNHAPEVELRVQGKQLSGRVRDALGPVRALEYAVDGAPYRPLLSDDGLLDTREERFRLDLGKLAPGTHMVSVRASDAAHNVSANAIEIAVER